MYGINCMKSEAQIRMKQDENRTKVQACSMDVYREIWYIGREPARCFMRLREIGKSVAAETDSAGEEKEWSIC